MKKLTRSPAKGRGLNDKIDMTQILLFYTMILMSFLSNLIKDWNVPNSHSSFNLSNKRIIYLVSLLLGFIFSLGSKVSSLSTFRTKPPFLKVCRFHFFVEHSSNPFLVSLCMVLCPSSLLIYQNQLLVSFLHLIFF